MSIKQVHSYDLVLNQVRIMLMLLKKEREALVEYAHHIGLAFQIQDDILDIEGTSNNLGKLLEKI